MRSILVCSLVLALGACAAPVRRESADAAATGTKPTPAAPAQAPAPVDPALAIARDVLREIRRHTGLSDLQVARVRYIEDALDRGNGGTALDLSQALLEELKIAAKPYTVQRDDTLWSISGRSEVYDNPYLWPLLWDANREVLKSPTALRRGQTLKVPSNPTIAEVVRALEQGKSRARGETYIGEIRPVEPGQ